MKLKKLMAILEEKYPLALAEEWDNVGLLLGDPEQEIHKVLFALDLTGKVIEYAIQEKADLIITHHPFLFHPIKKIQNSEIVGRKIFSLVKAGISVYTLHTNLDAQKQGLNDYILEKMGIFHSEILEPGVEGTGIGRFFSWEEGKTIEEVERLLQEKLQLSFLRVIGKTPKKRIRKVCFVNGSGMSYWKLAKEKSVDLFITGDIGYHDALDLRESEMIAMDVGHLEAERFFSELLLRDLIDCPFEKIVFQEEAVFEVSVR